MHETRVSSGRTTRVTATTSSCTPTATRTRNCTWPSSHSRSAPPRPKSSRREISQAIPGILLVHRSQRGRAPGLRRRGRAWAASCRWPGRPGPWGGAARRSATRSSPRVESVSSLEATAKILISAQSSSRPGPSDPLQHWSAGHSPVTETCQIRSHRTPHVSLARLLKRSTAQGATQGRSRERGRRDRKGNVRKGQR